MWRSNKKGNLHNIPNFFTSSKRWRRITMDNNLHSPWCTILNDVEDYVFFKVVFVVEEENNLDIKNETYRSLS